MRAVDFFGIRSSTAYLACLTYNSGILQNIESCMHIIKCPAPLEHGTSYVVGAGQAD